MSKDPKGVKIKAFLIISTALFVFSMLINWDIIEFNKNEEQPVVINDEITDDIEDVEEEEEVDITKIPPIQPPKDTEENDDKAVTKEEIKEIDGEEVLVKSAPEPKDKNLPKDVQKPKIESKPEESPKLEEEEKAKVKNSEEPPTYKKEEEKPKIVCGGTGSDGILRDLKGNPIPVEGDPNAKPNIVKGSDLGEPGDPEMGHGDKF